MSEKNLLKEITKDLTILCVDDEPLAREYMSLKLGRMFREVYVADDGATGLESFRKNKPDVIITDNRMTYMDGIEMIMTIREENSDIPIILATAYTEKDALVSAINCNVSHFLSKPIDAKKLDKAIEKCIQPLLAAKLSEQNLRQEIELLRYREKYHSHQENNAFKKELSLILNDYFLQKFNINNKYGTDYGVYTNILYKPLDILSGDIYSIRKIDENKTFIFLADSMGKGLPASVTSIITTSYLNHIVDDAIAKGGVNMREVIERFNGYIKSLLLEDEILSITFMLLDFYEETLEYSSFSCPPIFYKDEEGNVGQIRCNNPPLTKYLEDFAINTFDMKDAVSLMALTDGMYECATHCGDVVANKLPDIYAKSLMKTDFHNNLDKIINEVEDDITCIHLMKMKGDSDDCKKLSFNASLENVGKAIQWIEGYFDDIQLDIEDASMLTLAFTELTMNAFEHSIIGLDNKQKYRMINKGEYDKFIGSAASEKQINVCVDVTQLLGKRFLGIRIIDEGIGFDPQILKTWMYDREQSDGKGVRISRRIIDEIYYSSDGREVILLRVFEDEPDSNS
jgi:CheY-like chemotaxis protein/anti-sigma regulatory factor (Ser/Thr protein kinase)